MGLGAEGDGLLERTDDIDVAVDVDRGVPDAVLAGAARRDRRALGVATDHGRLGAAARDEREQPDTDQAAEGHSVSMAEMRAAWTEPGHRVSKRSARRRASARRPMRASASIAMSSRSWTKVPTG